MSTKIIIEHLSGSRRGKRVELDPVERVTFGRHPANDVVFDAHKDLAASTHHAELKREGEGYVLLDVGSSNGTYLAGHKVTRLPIQPATDYDIEFGEGGPRCRLFVGDPGAKALPATMVGRMSGPVPQTQVPGAKMPAAPTGSVAQLFRRAISDAKDREGGRPSTVFMQSLVNQALNRSTRKLKLVLAGTTVVFAAALVVVIVLLSRRTPPALAGIAPTPDARPAPDAGPVKVVEPDVEPAVKIAEANALAIYLIAYTDENGEDVPLCTAFAITHEVLATNAHCLEAMHEVEARKQKPYVVRNHDPIRYEIKWARWHRDYHGAFSPDVALVAVDGTMDTMVKLAGDQRLLGVRAGTQVYVYGFPGAAADPKEPEASVLNGMVGRLTRYSGERGSPEETFLLQHSAPTSPGTSGSPVFDAHGEVIAVNEGSRKDSAKGPVVPGLSLAVRMDALFPVLDDNVSGWRAAMVEP